MNDLTYAASIAEQVADYGNATRLARTLGRPRVGQGHRLTFTRTELLVLAILYRYDLTDPHARRELARVLLLALELVPRGPWLVIRKGTEGWSASCCHDLAENVADHPFSIVVDRLALDHFVDELIG